MIKEFNLDHIDDDDDDHLVESDLIIFDYDDDDDCDKKSDNLFILYCRQFLIIDLNDHHGKLVSLRLHYNSNPLEMTAIQTRMSIIIVDIIENEKKTSAPYEFGSKSSSSSSTSFGTKKLYSC
ncbi:hypothetical protein DERF_001540 [Dermatophagoides farinae]|uniref:Uncharacterized protein n=1 Tax=Dermatophagoides farinae TaxID=6954 RepID=A0A922LD10_DERFA|nr:hypothetical protein DERF_001540 [Dermatophagoides farinae]